MNEDIFRNVTNPIEKLVKETGSNIVDSVENAVVGNLSAALQRIGLGDGSNKTVLGNLGEQVLAGIAGEIFGAIGRELNLSSKTDIENLRGVVAEDNIFDASLGGSSLNDNNIDHLFFPSDLNEFYIQFNFKKYSRPAPYVAATVSTEWQLALPLPRELVDRHNILYNDKSELGFFGVIANGNQNPASDSLDLSTGAAYGGRLLIKRLTEHSGNIVGLVSQNFGASLNPHLSVMFEAPSLRSHKMQWLFAPNNEQESETIRKIAKRLRGAALPSFIREQTGEANFNILDYPMMCSITLYPWGDNSLFTGKANEPDRAYDGSMYTYKHCVIKDVTLNYAPDAVAFFNDDKRSPAFVSLEVSFLEIEYYTGDDFGRKGAEKSAKEFLEKTAIDVGLATGFTDMDAAQQAKVLGEQVRSTIDPTPVVYDDGSGFVSAQNINVDNSSLVDVYPTDYYDHPNNEPGLEKTLIKTTQGSWYEVIRENSGDTVRIIQRFDDPAFTTYNVLEENRNVTPDPALTSNDLIILSTGTDGVITWRKS